MEKKKAVVCCWMEDEFIDQMRATAPDQVEIVYRPDLFPLPQYPCDHAWDTAFKRTEEQQAEWEEILKDAEILFDFDKSMWDTIAEKAPNVRWIQSSSTGIGHLVKKFDYYNTFKKGVIITVAGTQSQPMAEFALLGLLWHSRGGEQMLQRKRDKQFVRFCPTDLAGETIAIVGLGRMGRRIAELCSALGMKTRGTALRPKENAVDEFYPVEQLDKMLEGCGYIVLTVPQTDQTDNMIGAEQLNKLRRGAYLINICRGSVVDEEALLAALNSGQLSGAALDVFAKQPLPQDHPFWTMENILMAPKCTSISEKENARLTDVFCKNLRHYLAGESLINILDPQLGY